MPPPSPTGLLQERGTGGVFEGVLINLSKEADGCPLHGGAAGSRRVHVGTVWKGVRTTLGFVFLPQNGRQIGQDVCLRPGRSAACYGWLGSSLEGAEVHLSGELSLEEEHSFWRGLAYSSPGDELQEVDEHWGRKSCSTPRKGDWFVLVVVLECLSGLCTLTWRTHSISRGREAASASKPSTPLINGPKMKIKAAFVFSF